MMQYYLELAGEKPFLQFGVAETGAAVVVDFVDFAFVGFDSKVVAVVPLPPALAAGGAFTEAVVRPGLQNFRDNVLVFIETKRDGNFNITAGGDLYLASEKILGHGSSITFLFMLAG